MPQLVLFDLDETLFDHGHASRTALTMLRREHAALARRPVRELETQAYRILESVHAKVLEGLLTVAEARLERLRLLFDGCGADLDPERLPSVATRYRETYQAARRPMSGARALLERIRRTHRIGIVTNNFRREQESKLSHCRLQGLVDFMVTFQEVGHAKPRPEIFRAALDRAGVSATEAVMVGDSWETDILGASGLGISPVWYNPRNRRRPDPRPVPEMQSFLPTERASRLILGG